MNYLALGDSYTIGEAVSKKDSFPYLLAKNLATPFKTIAKTGWTTTDLLDAIKKENTADSYGIISILIGVNNQYQGKSRMDYLRDLDELFLFISRKKPSKLIGISIPNYGFTPFGKAQRAYISHDLNWYNKTLKSYCEMNNGIWVDIESISRSGLKDKELLAPDLLHPSAKMYELISEKILSKIL